MKFEVMKSKLTRTCGKLFFMGKKHSPTILVAAGIAGVVTSGVLACRATLKLNDILAEHNDVVENIEAYVENEGYSEEYTEDDYRKDKAIVGVQTGAKLTKLYLPSILLLVASITAIVCSNRILTKRNVSLAAAYTAVDNAFKEYRKEVVDRFGSELDHELRYKVRKKDYEYTATDKDGKEQIVKKTEAEHANIDPNNPEAHSQYARYFDEGCAGWTKDAEHNLVHLKVVQAHFNDVLKNRGYVYLNEVYEALGIPKTKAGHVIGWIYDEKKSISENYIDFGMYNVAREDARDFVNGRERIILLDFNVHGNIWDMM